MQLTHLDRPLRPADRQKLMAFLASRAVVRGGMDPETLDGFFTALILCPEPVMPEAFLEPALGPRDSGLFATEDEASGWVSLLLRHWNGLSQRLLSGQPATPWLRPEKQHRGRSWARGFLRGMGVHPARWEAVRLQSPALLLPLVQLAGREDAPEPLEAGAAQALVAALPDTLQQLREAHHLR